MNYYFVVLQATHLVIYSFNQSAQHIQMETNISYPKGGTSISTNSSNTRQLIVSPREKKQDTMGF